jgi:ubiquinone/menaquinone biosynthesis C-methylase UbiE
MTELVLDLLQAQSADRILHLGCGDGSMARRLAPLACNGLVVGIDVEERVRNARRLSVDIENLMFVFGSAEEISWQEDFFSALVSLEPPSEGGARAMFRVLAPGGRLVGVAENAGVFAAAGFDLLRTQPTGEGAGLLVQAVKPVLK